MLVSRLAIDLTPGKVEVFRRGQEFECPDERALKLGNSVKILPGPGDPMDEPPETQPGRKRK